MAILGVAGSGNKAIVMAFSVEIILIVNLLTFILRHCHIGGFMALLFDANKQ